MFVSNYKKQISFRVFQTLGKVSRVKLTLFVVFQWVVNVMDLVGILGIASLATSSMDNSNSTQSNSSTRQNFVILELSENQLIAVILVSFLAKTILSILVTRQILSVASREFERTSSLLIRHLLTKKQAKEEKVSKQQSIYTCTRGVEFMYLQVLVPALNILTDFGLILMLLLGAFLVSPIVSLILVSVLFLIAVVLSFKLNGKIESLGAEYTNLTIESDEDIHDALLVKREIALFGVQDAFLDGIMLKRNNLGGVVAKAAFIPFVSKYLVEGGVVVSLALLSLISLLFDDKAEFMTILAVFAGIGARVTPAVLRVQQSILQMKTNSKIADLTLTAISESNDSSPDVAIVSNISTSTPTLNSSPEISLKSVNFDYSRNNQIFTDFTATVSPRGITAIVGASGVGKTTLVDLMLGFLEPNSGKITIDGFKPSLVMSSSPGLLSLVPQEIHILSLSLIENIALGVSPSKIEMEKVNQLIQECELSDIVDALPFGPWTPMGEKGIQLSGGQKQRVGIARALYRNPRVLFLDESTSALDSVTETLVNQKLFNNSLDRTTVVIAHRLSTVKNADKVFFLGSDGKYDVGKFDEIRSRNMEFDRQASTLGL